jgi:hypothetical protein
MTKTAKRIVIERILGIVLFLLVVWFANLMISYVNNEIFTSVVNFFNANIMMFIAISVLSLIAELMFNLIFPFDLFAPIITSVVSVIAVLIIIETLKFVGSVIGVDLFNKMDSFKYPILLAVIALTLILGYFQIFKRFLDSMDAEVEARNNNIYNNNQMMQNQGISSVNQNNLSWNDVNSEYKQAFYAFANSLRSFFNNKIKK